MAFHDFSEWQKTLPPVSDQGKMSAEESPSVDEPPHPGGTGGVTQAASNGDGCPRTKNLNKRNRSLDDFDLGDEEIRSSASSSPKHSSSQDSSASSRVPPFHPHGAKKARAENKEDSPATGDRGRVETREEENESDFTDYEDDDDFEIPADMEDYLDDADDGDVVEDDQGSVSSTRTTQSTGSVGSNTPSLVGENLENFSLGQTEAGPSGDKAKNPGIGGPLVTNTEPPLRRSLFSHVPPSIHFVHHNEVPETPLPAELRKNLRWKLSTITPAVVKKVVTNSGFRLMRKTSTEWGGTWGKHMKSPMFKELGVTQKINHFPGTFNIGRKDKLWKNYHKLRVKHGKEEFNFLPRTFCLPADTNALKKAWQKRGVRAKWIVKPPALARGNGIKVVNKWSQIPKQRPLVVQRYIAKPHLINGTKYDLRIYVLMTSLCPLRIYLYEEGLVRFASNKYTADSAQLSDVYMHLTNYSINKNSDSYKPNEDSEKREGHKWTLSSLWQYFSENGIDQKPVWDRIKDLVIKTIISAEHSMLPLNRANLNSQYCGYELFGFDVLLDSDLKPWLIEVNISPSLHSASPLDLDVKSPLATQVFNIARYQIPAKISPKTSKAIFKKLGMEDVTAPIAYDPRLFTREISKADRAKQNRILAAAEDRPTYLDTILDRLTPDDVRALIRAEDEYAQLTHFARIFPTQETYKYFKYFAAPRYHNLLADAWEVKYGDCRVAGIDRLEQLCQEKLHLKVPISNSSATTNTGEAKKIDVSGIKGTEWAATPAVPVVEPTAVVNSTPPTVETPASTPSSKPKKLGVVAKPHNVRSSFVLSRSASGSSVGKGQNPTKSSSLTSTASLSSPEPMSLGGDSDKSRSPSPVAVEINSPVDNSTKLRTSTSASLQVTSPESVTDKDNNSFRTENDV